MIYFAYASNLDPAQWAERCPASPAVGVATLADHRLHFPRRSAIRDCAVASIERAEGAIVWGVLYRMDAADFAVLDRREGHFPDDHPNESRYQRQTTAVVRRDGVAVAAHTYVAVPSPEPGFPSEAYLAHVIAGARHHGFPEDYVAALMRIRTREPA